ncbi:BQ2448_6414 [Microbotryum intermedium]|uniref:BQ2448_6414 protein n=1 Tax=Microbotryum intermedium TaxID=269621 RepID=A0A238FQ19_9BASI|nr:BQ2448_6414 [Microbotryum intermedium]
MRRIFGGATSTNVPANSASSSDNIISSPNGQPSHGNNNNNNIIIINNNDNGHSKGTDSSSGSATGSASALGTNLESVMVNYSLAIDPRQSNLSDGSETKKAGGGGGWFGGAFGEGNGHGQGIAFGVSSSSSSSHNNFNLSLGAGETSTRNYTSAPTTLGLASPNHGTTRSHEAEGISPISSTYSSGAAAFAPQAASDDLEDLKLPFGGRSTPRSPPSTRSAHTRSSSRSSSILLQKSTNGPSSSRPFSPLGMSQPSLSVSTRAGLTTAPDVKDKIMIDLLSGQAVVETKDYPILGWEEMQDVKKVSSALEDTLWFTVPKPLVLLSAQEHAVLATKIASLSRSLALEIRLRDSAAKLVRLSSSSPLPGSPTPTSASGSDASNRARVTKAQAEAQVQQANDKIEMIQTELYKIGWKEAESRTKLLRHTAGVLGLAVRRKEKEERGSSQTPLTGPRGFYGSPYSFGASPAASIGRDRQRSASPSDGPVNSRFDGYSFFAGNKEAIIPGLPTRTSPYASPNPSATTNGQFVVAGADASHATIRDLETQVAGLQRALKEERDRRADQVHPAQLRQLQDEVAQSRAAERSARDDNAQTRNELDRHITELNSIKNSHESLQREVEKTKEGLGHGEDDQRELGHLRQEIEEMTDKMQGLEQELNELEERAVASDRRVTDVEGLLEDMKIKHAHEVQRVQGDLQAARQEVERARLVAPRIPTPGETPEEEQRLRDEVASMRSERTKLSQTLADVLQRQRERANNLGTELPEGFDETAVDYHDNWSQYVASALDDHFDHTTSHATALSDELSLARLAQEHSANDLERELREAQEHRDHWQDEAEQHRQARKQLEAEHDELKATLQSHEERMASLTLSHQDLEASSEEKEHLRAQLDQAQGRISELEAQIADYDATHAALEKLWQSLPAVDARRQASDLHDLTLLRAAFDTSQRSANSPAPFSIDALVERIHALLADDAKLVDTLMLIENGTARTQQEVQTHRSNAERYQKLAEQHSTNLTVTQGKVKDLEERIEVSSQQEVTMLERLNDLTESLETTRAEKRKLETTGKGLEGQVEAAENEKNRLAAIVAGLKEENRAMKERPDHTTKMASLENLVQDLKDQLTDLEEELEDAKTREQKTRSQLLEELNAAQAEVSSLRTKLRQAERKASKTL